MCLEVTREEFVLLRLIGSVQNRQHVTLLAESTAGFLTSLKWTRTAMTRDRAYDTFDEGNDHGVVNCKQCHVSECPE